jgi:predicted transcriptional regulator
VHVFAATLNRDELVGRRLQAVAEKLCGGSWTPLLTHLVQGQRLSDRDRHMLRQLIQDHPAPAARKERRGKEHS